MKSIPHYQQNESFSDNFDQTVHFKNLNFDLAQNYESPDVDINFAKFLSGKYKTHFENSKGDLSWYFPHDTDFLARFLSNHETDLRNQPIILVIPEWKILSSLISSLKRIELFDKIDFDVQIFRQETKFSRRDSEFHICDAINKTEISTKLFRSFVSCRHFCPFFKQYQNKLKSQDYSFNLEDSDDIENLFTNFTCCPVVEFENYNRNIRTSQNSTTKIKISIVSSNGMMYYIQKKTILGGIEEYQNFFQNHRVVFFGCDLIKTRNIYQSSIYITDLDLENTKSKCSQIINNCQNENDSIQTINFKEDIKSFSSLIIDFIQKSNQPISYDKKTIKSNENDFFDIFNSFEFEEQEFINEILLFMFSSQFKQSHQYLGKKDSIFEINIPISNNIFHDCLYFTLAKRFDQSNNIKSISQIPQSSFFSQLKAYFPFSFFRSKNSELFSPQTIPASQLKTLISLLSSNNSKLYFRDIIPDISNSYKENVIQLNLQDKMFGIRIFSWYPTFYDIVDTYTEDSDDRILHLTGSPGIGKSTFIWYFILRWIRSIELGEKSPQITALNLEFYDQSNPNKIIILSSGQTFYFGEYTDLTVGNEVSDIIYQNLYYYKHGNVYRIKNNEDTKNLNNECLTFEYNNKYFNVTVDWRIFRIFYIIDGIPDLNKTRYGKVLMCSSYNKSHQCFGSKKFVTYLAPLCYPNEFVNALLLSNSMNKKRILTFAPTIAGFINFNIRDTLSIANQYDYSCLGDYLILQMQHQLLKSEETYQILSHIIHNKKYIFIFCSDTDQPSRCFSIEQQQFIHFTSESSENLSYQMKNDQQLKEQEKVLKLINSIVNLENKSLQGILFEASSRFKLNHPFLLNCIEMISDSSGQLRENTDHQHFQLFFNACSEVIEIHYSKHDLEINEFARKISENKNKYVNYLFIPKNNQKLYDFILYDVSQNVLYLFQMTVGQTHGFRGTELDTIYEALTKAQTKVNNVIYIHFRNYRQNLHRSFLNRGENQTACHYLQKYETFKIYFCSLAIRESEDIILFYNSIKEQTPKQRFKEMVDFSSRYKNDENERKSHKSKK